MDRLRKILKRLFCLPPWLTVLIAVPSFVFVFCMLGTGNDSSVFSYLSYALSAYALIITATGITDIVKAVRKGIDHLPLLQKIRNIPVGERYLSDVGFRSEVSLYGGLLINLLYIAMKLFSGIWYRSVWFISLAVYYMFLAVMRFLLLHHVRKVPIGQNIASEFRRYRACGFVLLLMNQALAGIIVSIVYKNQGFSYPGLLIYAMATYAFYMIITAVINVVKFRKHGSPILSAAKVINLTAALVSMLSLETAMLAQFGGDDSAFRQIMTASSGGVICVIVLGMAIYMIVRANRELKKYKINKSETKPHRFDNR